LRRELIENFIGAAPERLKDRLNGIQCQVDSVRHLSRGSALGATVRIYQLMWQSFRRLNHNWQDLVQMRDDYEHRQCTRLSAPYPATSSARVLEFRPRRDAKVVENR
jgi:aryl carrier-like protein